MAVTSGTRNSLRVRRHGSSTFERVHDRAENNSGRVFDRGRIIGDMDQLEGLRYPVGRPLRATSALDAETRRSYIDVLEQAPARYRALTAGLTDAQLDTPYRPGGWTVRQVVHHVPDSHMNAYVRMKLAL